MYSSFLRLQEGTLLLIALPALLLLAACGGSGSGPGPAVTDSASASASGRAAGTPAPAGDAAAAPATPVPASELHVNRTETFYDVTGRTARALLHDLTRRGPRIGSRRHFGRTAWTARWHIKYEAPAGGASREAPCRMRRADVFLNVDVTLPRWEAPSDASPSLRRDWNSFTDALAFHEREHEESIISAGRRVVRALDGLEAPSCPALEKKAEAEARAIIERARDYNRRYDERTGHGETQGARWPR